MKPILLSFLLLLTCGILLAQQEQPTGINATFIFLQGKDTVDLKKPVIYGSSGSLQFLVRSRVKITRVYYEVTGGPAGGKPVGTLQDFSPQYIFFRGFSNSLRPGDVVSVAIQYMEDEEGKRYKLQKATTALP